MIRQIPFAAAGALHLLPATAPAVARAVTLKVERMTCAACPACVHSPLCGARGVRQVIMLYGSKTAMVI